jgi:hypothetical protein
MKDHQTNSGSTTRYLALRTRRRRLLRSPAVRARDNGAALLLPRPIVHSTYNDGLRRDQLLGDFATVQVTVGPWDFPNMTDVILLHWGDQWTQSFPVKDTNGAQLLAIPGADIAGDPSGNGDHYSGEGRHEVWYEIKTIAGAHPPSAVTEVAVKTARPGGEDPKPDTPINDNLKAPVAAPDPVEQNTVEVTFAVAPWANIFTDDKLTLVLGGYRFDFPAITNATATQTLTLSAEQIAAIGGGPQTPVTYEVIDRVGNRSGYAPYLLLDIWLETGDRLEKIELFDGAIQPIQGAIDPLMTDGFARVPRYLNWQAGESVTVVLEGVDSNEQPHETRLPAKTWNATDYYLDFALPGDALLVLAGGIVRVRYETNSGGISYRRLYVVDALPETKLPPVTVIGEQGGELALDGITGDYVSIVIPDSEVLIDFARITLSMQGAGNSGPVLEEEIHNVGEGEGHKPYAFSWLKSRVALLLEHAATFSYTIRTLDGASRYGNLRLYRPLGIRDSEPHDLLIRQTGAPGQLAPPIVHDLVDGAVLPSLPRLRLTVPAGIASVPGAKVLTTVAGLTTATHTDMIFDNGEAIVVDFPGWPAVNDGAPAKAFYTIDGKPSQETSFLVGVPRGLPAPTIDEADGNQLDPFKVLSGATFRISDDADLQPNDTVTATVAGTSGSFTTTPPVPAKPGMTLTIPAGEFARHLGDSVSAFYTRKRDESSQASDTLSLQVLDIQDDDPNVKPPTIVEADSNTHVLDLNTLPGDATIAIAAWPLMAAGQRYSLIASLDGQSETIADRLLIENAGPFSLALPRTLLDTLPDYGRLTLSLRVAFDTGGDRTTSFDSPMYTVRVATPLVLLPPEPDFLEPDPEHPDVAGKIQVSSVTDPRGLKITVKKFQGMAVNQRIRLTCISASHGEQLIGEKDVVAIADCEFFMTKGQINDIIAAIDPAKVGFEYTVIGTGENEVSPLTKVRFQNT